MNETSQTTPTPVDQEAVTIVSPKTMGGFTEGNTIAAIIPKQTIKNYKYLIIGCIVLFFILFIGLGGFVFYKFFLPKATLPIQPDINTNKTTNNPMYRVDQENYAYEFSYNPALVYENDAFYFSPFLRDINGGYFKVYDSETDYDYTSLFDLVEPTVTTSEEVPTAKVIEGQRSLDVNSENIIIYTKIFAFTDGERDIAFEFNIDKDNVFKDEYLKLFNESAKSFVFTKGPALDRLPTEESTPSLPAQ